MLKTRPSICLFLLCFLMLASAGAAQAGVLVATARVNNPFNYTYAPGGSSSSPVALDDVGNTSKTFNLPSAQTVVITISAECSGGSAGTTVTANVVLDGLTIANGDNGTPLRAVRWCLGGVAPEMITRTVYASLSAGNHTVQVQAAIEAPLFTFHSAKLEKIVLTVTN